MVLAADYPFLDILWSMIIFFAWVVWIWMMFTILADVFRRSDINGWAKSAWVIFMLVLPFLGVLVYLIANNDGMRDRALKQAENQQAQFDDYVRSVGGGGGPAEEIAKANDLLKNGAITPEEFAAIKAKALA